MVIGAGGTHSIYSGNYVDNVNRYQTQEAEKKQDNTHAQEAIPVPKDEYIKGEDTEKKPIGLYRMGKDDEGNPKIIYDKPEEKENFHRKESAGSISGVADSKAEKCTTNTDKVDREIKKLKEEKKQLEQQLRAAAGDEKKTEELNKKISAIENELRQKDNDTYRQQHAVIS